MKRAVLILCLSVLAFSLSAQNRAADSLRGLLKNAKEDTNKVIWTVKLGLALFNDADHKELVGIFSEAKALAEKISYPKGFANACNNLGILYFNQGLYSKALEAHLAALRKREEIKDTKGMAS